MLPIFLHHASIASMMDDGGWNMGTSFEYLKFGTRTLQYYRCSIYIWSTAAIRYWYSKLWELSTWGSLL